MSDREQGSPEWFQVRLGKVTASRVSDVIAKTKSGWSASRANYLAQLVAERLTGQPQESYTNAAMQWGTDNEPLARAAYEFRTDATVTPAWFIDHPNIPMTGASPDGLIGNVGLVEIKCPNTSTHIETLLGKTIPSKYETQMQWQMACTGVQWCDFVSFDPRMPEAMRLFVCRLPRDDKRIAELEAEIKAFLKELDDKVNAPSNLYATQKEAA